MRVPDILLSGNHKEIKAWRNEKMIQRTLRRIKESTAFEKLNSQERNEINQLKSSNINEKDLLKISEIYPDW